MGLGQRWRVARAWIWASDACGVKLGNWWGMARPKAQAGGEVWRDCGPVSEQVSKQASTCISGAPFYCLCGASLVHL